MKEDERRCAAMIIARWREKLFCFFSLSSFLLALQQLAVESGLEPFNPAIKTILRAQQQHGKKQQQQQEELLSEAECNLQSSSASTKSLCTFFSLGELANSGLVLQSFSEFWVFSWLMQYCAECDDSERAESWAWEVGVVGWLGMCLLAPGLLSSSPSPFLSLQKKESLIYTYIERRCRRRHQQASWMFSLRTLRGCFTRTWVAWQEYSRSLIVILPSLPNAIAPDAIPICMVCPPTSYVCLPVCLSVTHSDRIPQKSSLRQNGKCGCVCVGERFYSWTKNWSLWIFLFLFVWTSANHADCFWKAIPWAPLQSCIRHGIHPFSFLAVVFFFFFCWILFVHVFFHQSSLKASNTKQQSKSGGLWSFFPSSSHTFVIIVSVGNGQ